MLPYPLRLQCQQYFLTRAGFSQEIVPRPTKALFVMFILGSLWIQYVNGLSKPSQATFDNSDLTDAAGFNAFYMGYIVMPE